jgi:uncharacterized protein YeeX (DUF496 family)
VSILKGWEGHHHDFKILRWIESIQEAGTSVKIFQIKEAEVEKMEKDIPKKLKSVPDTMKIHQVC